MGWEEEEIEKVPFVPLMPSALKTTQCVSRETGIINRGCNMRRSRKIRFP